MQDPREKEARRLKLEQEMSALETSADLWDFWDRHPNLTLARLSKEADPDRIVSILATEVDKETGADVDLVIRSWTLTKDPKEAQKKIDASIDLIDRRKGRKMGAFLKPHDTPYSLERSVSTVLSRDYGKTCVRISKQDIERAVEELKKQGKVITAKTIEDHLYNTLPHEPYMTKHERAKLGLV